MFGVLRTRAQSAGRGEEQGVLRWWALAAESRAVDEEPLHSPGNALAVFGAGGGVG